MKENCKNRAIFFLMVFKIVDRRFLLKNSCIRYKMRIKHNNANIYIEDIRNKKQVSSNTSFKCTKPVKVSAILESVRSNIGSGAAENFEKAINAILKEKKSPAVLNDGVIDFKERTGGQKLYQQVFDSIIHIPVDLANATLIRLKKLFKNSKALDNLYQSKSLRERREHIDNFSNTMAIKHYIEMMQNDSLKGKIPKEALKRFDPNRANYTTRTDRSLTRVFTGVIPAFFLANDAYNLSMYINNDKDLAKKEKKRRFNQEIIRVGITAASTFGVLGFLAKKTNSNPESATAILTILTLASEVIGRAMAKTPFYPISQKQAKKYADLQEKNNLKHNQDYDKDKNDKQKSSNKSTKGNLKTDYTMKVLASLIGIGIAMEMLPKYIRPIKSLTSKILNKYNRAIRDDYVISKKEFSNLMQQLKSNGFEQVAKSYEDLFEKVIKNGNLTYNESNRVEDEINKIVNCKLKNKLFITKKIVAEEKEIRKTINRDDIIKKLGILNKSDAEVVNLGGYISKPKDSIGRIILVPVQFMKSVLTMPYQYVIKPCVVLPINFIKKNVLKKPVQPKVSEVKFDLINGLDILKKHSKTSDYKNRINTLLINSFDDVNKSNFSNAELSGAAKIAVSTATSAFLIFDNYNMVMIDSEGKDKKLASQKAKERTLQRIVRIAYGASIINLINKLFEKQFNASLLGAQIINVVTTLIVESLERKSVGLPLNEATRDEIIENDNQTLKATGAKGAYFRFMAKLTGKKPISTMKQNNTK